MEFIFWNLNNNVNSLNLIDSIDFDEKQMVFGISEFWDIKDRLDEIENFSDNKKVWHDERRTGILYSRSVFVEPYGGTEYYSLYKINFAGFDLLLAVVHLRSKLREENYLINLKIVEEMLPALAEKEDRNVIIMGDFNHSLHEDQITNIYHTNSTNYYFERERHFKVCGATNTNVMKFYNPIQSFSGDLSPGPPGTYYYNNQIHSQSWQIFDNILVSYPLAGYLDKDNCGIKTEIVGCNLLSSNGRPNNDEYSDHLPIKIKLSWEG